jgi:hypothetical protein
MYAIASSITRREAEMVGEIAREVGLLEQRVMADVDEDPQRFLSQLFAARHQLSTIKTMAEQGSEIYRRAIKLTRFAPPEGLELPKEVFDQYQTVAQRPELAGLTDNHIWSPVGDDLAQCWQRGLGIEATEDLGQHSAIRFVEWQFLDTSEYLAD